MSGLRPLLWRALKARPLRSALTVAAVGLGIAAVLGVQVTVDGLDREATAAQQLRAGSSALDVRVDSGGGLTAAQVAELAAITGVSSAVPLQEKRVVATPEAAGAAGLVVTLVGLEQGGAALRPVQLAQGRLPHSQSLSEVAIDSGLASSLSATPGSALRVGDRIQLITGTGPDQFTVVGLTSGTSGGPSFTRSAVFIDDAAMTTTFRLGLRTPLVALRLTPQASSATVASAVHARLGGGVTTIDPRVGATEPLGDMRPLLILVTGLSILLGAAVTANSAALSVVERRREIGLLRAAGGSSQQVFRLFALETIALAAASVPLGVGAGIALGALLDRAYNPADLAAPVLSVDGGQIAIAIAAGVGAALLGGLLPAGAAARLPVLDALRPAPTRGRGGPQRMSLSAMITAVVATAVRVLPGGSATAARNLSRHRMRTALTASGIAVSVAVAVAISALSAGALAASDGWVFHLFPGSTVLTSAVTQPDRVAAAISSEPATGSVTELRIFAEPVAGHVVGVAAIDPAAFRAGGALQVQGADRDTALAALQTGPAVLVPQDLAAAAGWTPGSTLPVATGRGTVDLTVAGEVAHSFPAGDGSEALLMDARQAQACFGAVAGGFDDLLLTGSGDHPGIAAAASRYGLQAVPVAAVAAAARNAVGQSVGLLVALAIVAVAIAVLAVANTLVTSVRQGTREIALLRAVGLGDSQALRTVLAESGLLALAAAGLGIAAGCLIALPTLAASATPGFEPSFAFPLVTAATLAAAAFLSTVVATLGPARRAVATSVRTALRQE